VLLTSVRPLMRSRSWVVTSQTCARGRLMCKRQRLPPMLHRFPRTVCELLHARRSRTRSTASRPTAAGGRCCAMCIRTRRGRGLMCCC
jgi:hypothetical protein